MRFPAWLRWLFGLGSRRSPDELPPRRRAIPRERAQAVRPERTRVALEAPRAPLPAQPGRGQRASPAQRALEAREFAGPRAPLPVRPGPVQEPRAAPEALGEIRERGPRAPLPMRPAPASSTDAVEPPERAYERAVPTASIVGNLDDESRLSIVLDGEDGDLMWSIERRIERGKFQLPQLPSTSVAAIELTSHPSADIAELSQMISADPLLCSELLKTVNSALYAAQVPAETMHDAIMRIGLRALRSLILSVSMRGVILRGNGLSEYAQEVWRQALSLGAIARAIAPELRAEPEKAFMLGLLQDIGKIALLTMLRDEVRQRSDLTPALVGRVFHRFHERAGAAMAKAWHLPAELASVAGCHHDYASNTEFPQSAALASLAHQLDLFLSLGDQQRFNELARSEIMDFLGVPDAGRHRILALAQDAYERAHASAVAA
jgi:HD-like signal output (HDOD) protein